MCCAAEGSRVSGTATLLQRNLYTDRRSCFEASRAVAEFIARETPSVFIAEYVYPAGSQVCISGFMVQSFNRWILISLEL